MSRTPDREPMADLDLVVVGGCGHVGLPLALAFARVGCRVGIYDTDETRMATVRGGQMPFRETGADSLLVSMLASGRLEFSTTSEIVRRTATVVTVVGTPIDEFLNPSTRVFDRVVDQLAPELRDGALLVLRSTVYPGTTDFVHARLQARGRPVEVVFCPERIAEGHALEEIGLFPQLIGASSDSGFERARTLFDKLDVETQRTTPTEAELAKLLTNAWRYMKFAIANQFFEIAHRANVDYGRVLEAVRHAYPRAADLPGPGFAAGPCLLKDTMQLGAFNHGAFNLGQAAMMINEGLPYLLVQDIKRAYPLADMTVGILGMAFKAESDDTRSSLSYKLKRLLRFRANRVLCTDPYAHDDVDLWPLAEVLAESDLLVIATPHRQYADLEAGVPIVDVWNLLGNGERV